MPMVCGMWILLHVLYEPNNYCNNEKNKVGGGDDLIVNINCSYAFMYVYLLVQFDL